jgi:hypothetical protein
LAERIARRGQQHEPAQALGLLRCCPNLLNTGTTDVNVASRDWLKSFLHPNG